MSPRSKILPLLLIGCVSGSPSAHAIELIGLTGIPAGCKSLGGGLLYAVNDMPAKQYSASEIQCGETTYYLLKRLIGYDSKKSPVWKIVDGIQQPRLKPGEEFISAGYCNAKTASQFQMAGIGVMKKQKDGSYEAKTVSHAWIYNTRKEKIEIISVSGVSCAQDGSGD